MGTFEWGYRRGNPDHNREEYLSQKDHTFKAKLKWHDGYGGHGEHYYDYNHGDAGYKAAPKPAYPPGLHSEVQEQYVEAPAGDARICRSYFLQIPEKPHHHVQILQSSLFVCDSEI